VQTQEEIINLLEKEDQTQVLRFADQLSDQQKQTLFDQISAVDFSMIREARKPQEEEKEAVIETLSTMTIDQIKASREAYETIGKKVLSEGKVAAVLLAGGQGTRLGYDGPKGTLNIGLTRPLYLFQILLGNMEKNLEGTGRYMHLYIMTSALNDQATRDFFREHDYFGYPKEYIHFFQQEMAPALDRDGHMLLADKDKLCLAPNGNGGWFRSLEHNGMIEDMKKSGVEWLNVFSVDNVLQNIADPVFIGATIACRQYAAAKVIAKATPEEKVGAVCLRNGRPSVVEYSELSDQMRYAKDEKGQYLYNYGVTLNYLFHLQKTQKMAQKHLPIHKALKKINCLDEQGHLIIPDAPNAYKLEYFIFDILQFFDSILSYEVVRQDEFAPIKNKSGVDSLDTARALLVNKTGITL